MKNKLTKCDRCGGKFELEDFPHLDEIMVCISCRQAMTLELENTKLKIEVECIKVEIERLKNGAIIWQHAFEYQETDNAKLKSLFVEIFTGIVKRLKTMTRRESDNLLIYVESSDIKEVFTSKLKEAGIELEAK